MLANAFYLAATWLILALLLTLLLGTRWRWRGWFLSLPYLAVVIGAGDLIALEVFREPVLVVVAASAVAASAGILVSLLLPDWNPPGQTFFLFSVLTVAVYLLYAFVVTAFIAASPLSFLFSFLLLVLETAALSLSLTYAFEVLDVLCRVRWGHRPTYKSFGAYAPMVSLHVPAYNEPPELVEKTLRALAALDYPNYEVILVDNNTPDEAVWRPLVEVCREYGFKCLHLDRWPGYKSGALNFALAMTDPQAEIIGVIDADYIVEPDYLRRVVPFLEDPEVAFVQTPQDYRDYQENRFFQAAYDGYKYFFALSMPSRNERNAIIFCGTMGLLRKKVLQEIGGWDEWCITEDAEASLRILARGYKAVYVAETFGRGLMPLNFEGLKKQRFRWAFGGVQILKKHWSKLLPWAPWIEPESRLTGAQRYFYLVSGLQWFNELLTFVFTIMVLISATLSITGHASLLRPTTQAFVILPIVLIGTNVLRALWGLREALSLSWKRAFNALTLWFSLTWVVALACLQAVVRERGVFLRTPKTRADAIWARALQAASLETMLGTACILSGVGLVIHSLSLLTGGLMVLCLSQSMIYLSAPSQSLLSLESAAGRRAVQPDRGEISGRYANESRLGLQIVLVAIALLLLAYAASLLPVSNTAPPWYGVFNPQPLVTPQTGPGVKLPALSPGGISTPLITPTGTPTVGTLTPTPGASPTVTSTPAGTVSPTLGATVSPTPAATDTLTPAATDTPTPAPSDTPTPNPTATPTATPTRGAAPGTATPAPSANPT